MPQRRAAPHSASSTRITGGAKQRRRDGETGGIAASIEPIQRDGATPDWAESSSVIGQSIFAAWDQQLFDPIELPDGRKLVTLRDAAQYITELP
jgi:hypothetical protein